MSRHIFRLVAWAQLAFTAALVPGFVHAQAQPPSGQLVRFNQTCDASAVVLTRSGDLLVGDDGDNILRTYRPNGGDPYEEIDVYAHSKVNVTRQRSFSQIEGAARVGDRFYWIGSHSRSALGWFQGDRFRLFALKIQSGDEGGTAVPIDMAYRTLHRDLAMAPNLKSVNLASSIMYMHPRVRNLTPDNRGINIQGLAAAKDGKGLLIGLRNPKLRTKAIVIPFMNPSRVLAKVADPIFGDPILLQLGGLGIVSMDLATQEGAYYIVAAPHNMDFGHKLYRWSGEPGDAPVFLKGVDTDGIRPEGMTVSRDGKRLVLLSDDGQLSIPVEDASGCRITLETDGGCMCSFLADPKKKSFQGLWIDIPSAPPARSPAAVTPKAPGRPAS